MKKNLPTISNRFIETVCNRLAENKQVRRSLPVWGRVHIDRQLPFLCIYRKQSDEDDSLFEKLIMGEASYLITTAKRQQHKQLALLVKNIAQTLKKSFGSFLLIEVWSAPAEALELPLYQPAFKIFTSKKTEISSTIETLEKAIKEIVIRKKAAKVDIIPSTKISPPGLPQLFTPAEKKILGFHTIGIEVRPIYQNISTGQFFPIIRQNLQRRFGRALKNGFFEFTNNHTKFRPLNYQSLGRWSMVKAVWEVDQQLADICNGFDFLLQVTPSNSNAAWSTFKRNHYERTPKFSYRPLPMDPALAKRRLYNIPIERIEDPTLALLFREQQLELDRKFTMLLDRGTPNFMFGSLQLYGSVEDTLMELADNLLAKYSPRSRDGSQGKFVDAKIFAAKARQELDYFQKLSPGNNSKAFIRNDITGLMVSNGNLLIGSQLKIPENRIEALIQHEIGTHVLTYLNGKAQPFRQLYIGLAGYEELQEGLAVLSEYLVDGLTRPRMRLLASRVVAARHMISGASFVDVFRIFNKEYGFERLTAFNITMRTFRCGGFTKDAVYLRGLVQLLGYLKNGGELKPLYIGKISANHVSIINELQWRKVLKPPPLYPRYLLKPQTTNKLAELKNGLTPLNLITRR